MQAWLNGIRDWLGRLGRRSARAGRGKTRARRARATARDRRKGHKSAKLGFNDARGYRRQEPAPCAFCAVARSCLGRLWHGLAHAVHGLGGVMRAAAARVLGWLRADQEHGRATHAPRVFRRNIYPGSRNRRFELHVPRGWRGNDPVPLVMVLHGCRQTSGDIRRISNFDRLADRERFIAVYPFVTSHSIMRIRNCWGWWLPGEIRPGAGEVEDLWQIVEQVRGEFSIDENRIHIAGLSSGGGMAVAAMVAHADRIASGAVVAGLPYSETAHALTLAGPPVFKPVDAVVDAMRSVVGEQGRPSPIFIVHSHGDRLVDIQAARNIRDSWAECHGIDTSRPASTRAGTTRGAAWVHDTFREPGTRTAVETLFIEGRDHGWYGGSPGEFSYPDAPDISVLMWRFFRRHPLYGQAHGETRWRQMLGVG